MQENFNSVLFDLDGTVLDTAHGLTHALNRLRENFNLPALGVNVVREYAGKGVLPMLSRFLDLNDNEANEAELREQYLAFYEACMIEMTTYFDGMKAVLDHIENKGLPWGIVTNKHTWLTEPLLDSLSLTERAGCLVCGDTLPLKKPDPAPLLHACQQLKIDPAHCVYIGDSQNDIIAGKKSGMKTILAAYGYLPKNVNHAAWEADYTIHNPIELLEIL